MIARLTMAYARRRIAAVKSPGGPKMQHVNPLIHDIWQNASPLMRVLISARQQGIWQRQSQDMIFLEDIDELQARYLGEGPLFRSRTESENRLDSILNGKRIEHFAGNEWKLRIDTATNLAGQKFNLYVYKDGTGEISLKDQLPEGVIQGLDKQPLSKLIDLAGRFPSLSKMIFQDMPVPPTNVPGTKKTQPGEDLILTWDKDPLAIPTVTEREVEQAVRAGQWLRWAHRVKVWWPSRWSPIAFLTGLLIIYLTYDAPDGTLLVPLNSLAQGITAFAVGTIICDWLIMRGHGKTNKIYSSMHRMRSLRDIKRDLHRPS